MVAERRRGLAGLLFSLALALPVRGAVVFETQWLSIQIDDTGAVRCLAGRRGVVLLSEGRQAGNADNPMTTARR